MRVFSPGFEEEYAFEYPRVFSSLVLQRREGLPNSVGFSPLNSSIPLVMWLGVSKKKIFCVNPNGYLS